MDYDDNEFQSQTFHLADEDNIKFSSGLDSYSLPKFDLDDNLQVHLRYDSLVESEVLLGIHNQDENQWIEDFSGGSSGIEFGSSAAESCSISKRNNVWSEATSSESVEMLLKSVGQDEMIMEQTIIEESDGCDALDSLTNQMEPDLNQDGSALSKMDDAINVPPDKCLENFSRLVKDSDDQLLRVESMPQTDEGGISVSGSSKDLGPSILSGKCNFGGTEGNLVIDGNLNEAEQKEDLLFDRSEENKTQEDSTVFESMQVDLSYTSVQSFSVDDGDLSQHVQLKAAALQTDKAEEVRDQQVLSSEAQMGSQIFDGTTIITSHSGVGNPSNSALKADYMVQVREVGNVAFSENYVHTSNWEGGVLSKDVEMGGMLTGNAQEASFLVVDGDNSSEAHSVDINSSAAGSLSGTVLKVDPSKQISQGHINVESSEKQGDILEKDGQQLDDGISVSNAEILPVEENTIFNGPGRESCNDNIEDSSSLVVEMCMSTKEIHESQTENTSDGGLGVHSGDICPEVHISSSMQVECMQRCDRIEAGDVHISHPDTSVLGKENARLATDSGIMEIEPHGSPTMGKRESSSSLGQCTAATEAIVPELPAGQIFGDKIVSTGVDSEAANLITNNKMTGVHQLPLGSGGAEVEVIEHEEVADSPLPAEDSIHLVKKEENVTSISMEPKFLIVKESSQMENDADPSSEFEHGAGRGDAGEMRSEVVGQSSSPTRIVTTMCQNEPQSPVANKATQQCSPELEGCPVIHDSSVKENDGAEACGKCESPIKATGDSLNGCESTFRPAAFSIEDAEFHSLEAGSSSPKFNELNCGSPTVISCVQVSQTEKEHQEEDKGSLDKKAPVSDHIDGEANELRSTAHVPKENDASEDDRSFTFEVSSLSELSERETINGWKPFPSIQPCESLQTVGSSSTASGLCRLEPNMVQEISLKNLLTTSGKNLHHSSKGNAEDKTVTVSGKATDDKTVKEGKPYKDDLPQSGKEHKESESGIIDQRTPVSDNIDRGGTSARCIPHDAKENNVAEVGRSFPFEVSSLAGLSERESGNRRKPFPSIQPCEFPQTVGVSPTTSGLCKIDTKALQEMPRGSPRTSGGKNVRRSAKGNVEDKRKPLSCKAANKETAMDGTVKDILPVKQTKARGSNLRSASPSSLGDMSQVVQSEEIRPVGYFEGSSTKPCALPFVQTSNLPDLNSSVSSSALFQQPFTDFQQVQLRAQIFVYGSLLQGTAPDEAYMMSAFGESDGGRSSWENVWRVAVERLHNQKSPLSNTETPLQLHSSARVPESATRQGVYQSEALSTPGRAGSKATPSAIINPVMPLSSPVWTISTPSRDGLHPNSVSRGSLVDSPQLLFPLHPYQSPHVRHYVGNTTPWLPQAPSPANWVAPAQTSAIDGIAHYPALPISETVHVTSLGESSVPCPSGMQYVPLSPFIHTGGSASVPAGTPLPMEAKMTAVSPVKRLAADSKSKKRKKSSASEEPGQISSLVQPQANTISATAQLSTFVTTATAISATKVTSGSVVLTSSPISSTHYQIIGGRDTVQRVIFSEETSSRIEQARQQAEDAAALAASAVRHSQSIWSQLAIQKNAGLASDVEAKLASSAVAIAAAASVAKAAAAAAKVASNAALQAKLMADEALVASKSGNPTTEASFDDGAKNLGKVTPASILKGKEKNKNSESILVAAKEAARKRVEAASAATKRAENLDAIVKAAGMAAEAVSQAGTIIAMGEPIPLTLGELVEAGPEGYWKVQRASSEQLVKSNPINREQANMDGVEEGRGKSVEHFNDWPSTMKATPRTTDQGKVLPSKEISRQSVENNAWLVNGMHWDSVAGSEQGLGVRKGSKMSNLAKTIGVVPQSQIGSTNALITVQNEEYEHQPIGASKENSIKEGSLVEVRSDKEGLRRAWFSAKVLSLKDGKACVCYLELMRDEGFGQPTEWVPLGGEGGKAPRIRIAHPMTLIKYEGAKKRGRAVRGDYTWSVGDKVDALICDGWREGIITEKSKEDETNLTVHFPAQGDTSVVRAWNLRPSVIWEDGQWVEWSRSKEHDCYYHEGDTPQEKPPKKGRHGPKINSAVEARGNDNMPKHTSIEEPGKTETAGSLPLSEKEKIFTVGKKIKEDNKSDTLGTKRTGLQKEGSRVIFGVPKPGKKKKFMEVSKHYVADRGGKTSEGNDSVKFTKFLIPQGSTSLGWKNTSKVISKGKQVPDSKPKVPKSGVTKNFPNRKISEKNSSSNSVVSASNHGTVQDQLLNVRASVGHDESLSEMQNPQQIGSKTRKIVENPALLSSLDLSSNVPSSKRKSPPAVTADPGSKLNYAPSGEKLARKGESDGGHNDHRGKSIPDAVEPRRSNRRIQPTSRLLEGLQSSLTISKIPAPSHDKSTKALQRNASSRGSNRG